MKKFVVILLIVELVVAYLAAGAGCILRQEEVRAFVAWHKNPTPETRVEFDRQKRISELQSLGLAGVLFCGMAGPTLFVAHIWSRKHKISEI